MRGGESNYNKVIIDGVPVNDPGGIFDFGVVPMNNMDRMELVRGPESTIYGSDAMTSMVQMLTATGETPKPQFVFGADGGTFSTANGYASVAGAHGIYDYNFFRDQFNTSGQGINDAYSNSFLGGNVGIRFSHRVALRWRLRRSNNFTGIQSNWWFNGNPVVPPDSTSRPTRTISSQRWRLRSAGPALGSIPSPATNTTSVRTNTDSYV